MQNSSQHFVKTLTAGLKAGGCAAKISALELQQLLRNLKPATVRPAANLLTSLENFEDAAVYKISEDLAIVQTVDFFPPMLDDPYLFGQVAATNALSDIYAMGGTPILALNIVCFPTCDFPMDVLQKILEGGASQVEQAGAILAGGHSIQSSEPIYGLSVTGFVHPNAMLTNSGAMAGDRLVLCKSIGTGVALLGLKAGSLSANAEQKLLHSMTTLSNEALEVSKSFDVHAATDITGFGLLGHVFEMAKGSKLRARIVGSEIRFLPETLPLAEQGFVPAGAYANRQAYEQEVSGAEKIELSVMDMLYDPQTAGGLLFAVSAGQAEALAEALNKQGVEAATIGDLQTGEPGKIEVVWNAKAN